MTFRIGDKVRVPAPQNPAKILIGTILEINPGVYNYYVIRIDNTIVRVGAPEAELLPFNDDLIKSWFGLEDTEK